MTLLYWDNCLVRLYDDVSHMLSCSVADRISHLCELTVTCVQRDYHNMALQVRTHYVHHCRRTHCALVSEYLTSVTLVLIEDEYLIYFIGATASLY